MKKLPSSSSVNLLFLGVNNTQSRPALTHWDTHDNLCTTRIRTDFEAAADLAHALKHTGQPNPSTTTVFQVL
jgi:hypothetical protein